MSIRWCIRFTIGWKGEAWVQVSSSPLGKAARIAAFPDAKWTGYEMVYQDAREWMMRAADMVVPMMYYQNDNFYPFVCDWVDHSAGRYAVAGLGAYRMEDESDWMVSDVTKQIDYVRENGMAGCAFFRCANVWWRMPVCSMPSRTIITNILPFFRRWPARQVCSRSAGSRCCKARRETTLVLTWAERDKTKPLTYTLYCSHTNRIDSDSAKCVLATHLTENRYVIPVDKTTDQGYLFSVSASTRYRNESPLSREVFIIVPNSKIIEVHATFKR